MALTISAVVAYAELVEAVKAGRRIRIDSDEYGEIVGTLRHFSPTHGSAAHLPHTSDLLRAWVRITTRQGGEMWVEAKHLVAWHNDGRAGWGV